MLQLCTAEPTDSAQAFRSCWQKSISRALPPAALADTLQERHGALGSKGTAAAGALLQAATGRAWLDPTCPGARTACSRQPALPHFRVKHKPSSGVSLLLALPSAGGSEHVSSLPAPCCLEAATPASWQSSMLTSHPGSLTEASLAALQGAWQPCWALRACLTQPRGATGGKSWCAAEPALARPLEKRPALLDAGSCLLGEAAETQGLSRAWSQP